LGHLLKKYKQNYFSKSTCSVYSPGLLGVKQEYHLLSMSVLVCQQEKCWESGWKSLNANRQKLKIYYRLKS